MPTYIMLTTLTDQGLQTLRSNPERLRAVNRDVEALGARVVHQWACLGPFDFVNIVEAPDAATISRLSVELGARGSAKLQSYELMEIDAFLTAIERTDGPTSLVLTRQGLPFQKRDAATIGAITRGGYVLADVPKPRALIIATGSEVQLAMAAQAKLAAETPNARITRSWARPAGGPRLRPPRRASASQSPVGRSR